MREIYIYTTISQYNLNFPNNAITQSTTQSIEIISSCYMYQITFD